MATPNVDKMSLKDLLELEAKVQKAINAARDRERSEVKQALAQLAEKRGFSVKASNPEAWYGPARLSEAEAAYQTAVRRLMAPSPKLQAHPRKRRK